MLRRSATTAAIFTLALGAPAYPQAAGPATLLAGPPDQEVLIEADQLVYGWEAQVLQLEGHVVVRRGEGLLRAQSGTLDRAHGILALQGGVLGVQGKDVFLTDEAVVDLHTRVADLRHATLYLKEKPANPDAPAAGKNALVLHGTRVRKLADGSYAAEEVRLTPCDCVGEPDYELLAHAAHLEGDRAHLSGVRLEFLGATLPLFPLALPLTQRQWGLLAPEFGFGSSYWFTYAQPVFLPLGQSNDLTVTPGYYTGGTTHALNEVPSQGNRAIKGPRLGLEWRYAPVRGTAGALDFNLFDDRDQFDSKAAGPLFVGEPGTSAGRGFGGVRGIAHWNHRTEAPGFVFAVQGAAATDVMAVRDPQPFALDSVQDLLRTDVGAWSAHGPLTLGAEATLMQDMRVAGATTDRRLFGAEARSTVQRLPGVFAQLAPMPLGPFQASAEASAVQFESLKAPGIEERTTGFGPTDRGASAGLPAPGYDASRRPALRLDLSPRLAIAGPASLPLDLRAEVGGRLDTWIVEGRRDRDRSRAYGLLGASAGLPLERRFGGLLHRLEPQVALRAITRPLQSDGRPIGDLTDAGGASFNSAPDAAQQGLPGGVPALRRPYDEIDFAAPLSGAVEATASLLQALWTRPGNRVFAFDLQQDFLLWTRRGRPRVGEGSASAGGQVGPASLGASVRYDWALHDLSALSAGGGARDGRGDEVHASLALLRGSSSERLRAGIDELFSAARFSVAPGDLTGNARVGASAPLPKAGLRAGYDLAWTPGDTPPDFANLYHSATLTYETPCSCAGLVLILGLPFHDGHLLKDRPDFSFRLDLKSLGSFATF